MLTMCKKQINIAFQNVQQLLNDWELYNYVMVNKHKFCYPIFMG